MKIKSDFSVLTLVVLLIGFTCNSCETSVLVKLPPVLSTNAVSLISYYTATCGGNISEDNGFEVLSRGVCWSLKPNPTLNDSISKDATGKGQFISTIRNLIPNTTYYLRAYATNLNGTAYGLQVIFKTMPPEVPILTTYEVTNITATTALSGGNVTLDGGSTVIARGVCWNTAPDPTILNNKTIESGGIGVFSSQLTSLTGGTYYLRSYATNGVGTAYGNQQVFAVAGPVSTVTDINGNVYHTVIIGNQTWLIENLRTTKFHNGVNISNVTDNYSWITAISGAWCDYNNNVDNGNKYGHLYNWYAVTDLRKLAPAGWHVATNEDLKTLSYYVFSNPGFSGTQNKALAATTDWASDTAEGVIGNNLYINNSTGFDALPGGYRDWITGSYFNIGVAGHWWMVATGTAVNPIFWSLYYNNTTPGSTCKNLNGFSVRCVRD